MTLCALVMLGAVLAASCSQSGDQFVSNRSLGTFFRIPGGWATADTTGAEDEGRVAEEPGTSKLIWHQQFSSGDPSAVDAVGLPTEVVGNVRVYLVSDYLRENTSHSALRKSIFLTDVDPKYPADQAQRDANRIVLEEPREQGDGLTGSRVVANLDLDGSEGQAFITQDVTTLFDDRQGVFYVLSVYCSGPCYERYQRDIDRIATSFTVRNDV